MTCSHCGGAGHNKKTCKNSPKVVNPQPKKKPGKPRVEKPATTVVPKKKPAKNIKTWELVYILIPRLAKPF